MNILIVNPILATPKGDGSLPKLATIKDTMIYGMCLGFLKSGHQPTLIAAADFRPSADEDYDFPVHFLPTSLRSIFKPTLLPLIPSFSSWLRRNHARFDLVITKECFSVATLQAARVCPAKTLVWQELAAHQRRFFRLPSRLWHNLIARPTMRRVAAVGCSPAARDFIARYLPLTSSDTVEHGIDSSKFRPLPDDAKQRRLITSSQLIPRKNVESIIRKFARLTALPGYADVRLIVCGDGDQRPYLEALTQQLGVASLVTFTGFIPRVALGQLVASSLAFLVDTNADLNVISIVESIAAGTPVVTNRVPLTAPWIQSRGLGIARNGWDAADLAEVIDNAPRFAARCRATAPSLSTEASAQALITLAAKQ